MVTGSPPGNYLHIHLFSLKGKNLNAVLICAFVKQWAVTQKGLGHFFQSYFSKKCMLSKSTAKMLQN